MDFIPMILRMISLFLDGIVYPFIGTVYNLLMDIANTTIFSTDIFEAFSDKIYALLGVFMLFKLSFSILTYIINPDDFSDKNKGFTKLITNVVITLALLVFTPMIFEQAMKVQGIILEENIIGRIFSINSSVVANNSFVDAGDRMAYQTLSAFYYLDTDSYSACNNVFNTGDILEDSKVRPCIENAFADSNKHDEYIDIFVRSHNSSNVGRYLDMDLALAKNSAGEYSMTYTAFVSTIAGVIIVLLLIVFCFDVAVRSIKLGFLRMLAPVPIISRLDPKKGKDTFDKWLKSCINTYLDLFIRLLAISFAVFVINQVMASGFFDAATGETTQVNGFVKVFIIMGALLFAKQLPKLIEEITGFKSEGKFTLNPMKKLKEVPGVEKASTTIGGTVAGVVAGQRVGNAALGGVLGFANGWKSSTLMGNGKGGFMAGANGAYKQLMGKDFLNFQFKPGGQKAVDEVGKPLKEAYAIRTELEKQLNVIASQTSKLAQNLVGNGVDINGDLSAQSSAASTAINQLNSAIAAKQAQIRGASGSRRAALNDELKVLQANLNKQQSIVSDIANYELFSEQETKVRTAISSVSKDIDDLSTEKKQRQNFYGVDPSPADDVVKIQGRVKKGINEYLK